MPNITIPISNVYNSVTRPITMMLARDVMAICGLDVDEVPLYLPGERGVVSQPGTGLGESDDVRYQSYDHVFCEVEDVIREDQILTTPVRERNDHAPVLVDSALKLEVRPVYVQYDLTFNFKYTTDSKNKAQQWRDELTIRTAESRHSIQHTLLYDLTLDDEILSHLSEVYNKREAIAGYSQSFLEWFESIQLKEVVARGAIDGDADKIVLQIPERQAHLVGTFNHGAPPVEQKVDGDVTYEIDFSYTVSYLKPTHWNIIYPLVIHQQHIGPGFYDDRPRVSIDDLDTNVSGVGWQSFERIAWRSRGRSNHNRGGLRYPYYDDWDVPLDPLYWSLPLMTWLMGIDVYNPTKLLDLKDLPDMEFSPNTWAYLVDNKDTLTRNYRSLLRFTLYEDDVPISPEMIYIDDEMVLRSLKPLNLRRMYHVRLSVVTSSIYLNPITINKALAHPLAVLEIYQTVIPLLDVECAIANFVDEGYLKLEYLELVLSTLEERGVGANGGHTLGRVIFHDPLPEVDCLELPPDYDTSPVNPPPIPISPNGVHKDPYAPDVPPSGDFEWESEEAVKAREEEALRKQQEEMDGVVAPQLPVLNNYIGYMTTQYLGIFVHRRD